MSPSARPKRSRSRAPSRVLAVATAFAAASLAVLSSGASAASARSLASFQSYNDTAGDCASPLAPTVAVSTCDIQRVNVSSNDRGLITFKVGIPGSPALTGDMEIIVYVDSDQNPATGGSLGLGRRGIGDYALDYWMYGGDSSKSNVVLWWLSSTVSSTEVSPTPSSLSASYTNGVATLTIGAADLGGIDNLDFYAVAYSGLKYDTSGYLQSWYDEVPSDVAPDTGSWSHKGNTPISAARLLGKFTVSTGKKLKLPATWTFKPLCSKGACAVKAAIPGWSPRFKLSRKSVTTYTGGFQSKVWCYTRNGLLVPAGTEKVSVRFTIKKAAWIGTTWRATGLAGTLRDRAPSCILKRKSYSGKVMTVTLPIKGTLK